MCWHAFSGALCPKSTLDFIYCNRKQGNIVKLLYKELNFGRG
jgi:hypothetical protein